MTQAGWYQDPSAPFLVRWWDGYRWTNEVRPGPGGAVDPAKDLADEAKYGRLASIAVLVGAASYTCQAVITAALVSRFFHAIRDQFNAPLQSDGTRAPLVLPHGITLLYVLSQLSGLVMLVVEVIFLVWFYNAAKVAARAGLPARRSPAWAVVGWIIPIVSLWFPYQSGVDFFPPGHPGRRKVGRWWALYLGMSVSLIVAAAVSFVGTGAGEVVAILAGGLSLAAALAARELITEVARVHAGLVGR